jgi:D-glycero-D-manno-heptose 1,7-bisphosphate phosphatase
VVTNQRGIALGRMTEADLGEVHARLADLLGREGAHLDLIVHCPHDNDECRCRKPQPGMLVEAARRLGTGAERAVMIGDSESDVEAGRRAGAATIRLGIDAPSLAAAIDAVLAGRVQAA